MTGTPGQEELGAQMASVRGEWAATLNEIPAPPSVVVPAGMTRAEFKEWKALQTEKAKARLQELEGRLTRLQQLEGKMQRLKTSSSNAIDAVPDHWTLPGAAAADGFGQEFGVPFSAEVYSQGTRFSHTYTLLCMSRNPFTCRADCAGLLQSDGKLGGSRGRA